MAYRAEREVDIKKRERAEKQIKQVFDMAVTVFTVSASKEGNTEQPWEDFSLEHLEKRLEEEFVEWSQSRKPEGVHYLKELLDVMVMAAIVYKAKIKRLTEAD